MNKGLEYIKSFFMGGNMRPKFAMPTVKPSKHQASKRGYKHAHNLSKGQRNSLAHIDKAMIKAIKENRSSNGGLKP